MIFQQGPHPRMVKEVSLGSYKGICKKIGNGACLLIFVAILGFNVRGWIHVNMLQGLIT